VPRIAAALLTLGIVIAARPVHADPVQLTTGALIGNERSARLHAASADHRFTIDGFGDRAGGIYWPAESCDLVPECVPGMALNLGAEWSGSDFPGAAAVDGKSFTLSGGDEAGAFVSFSGSWQAPAFEGRSMATVRAPFVFEGVFSYPSAGFPNPPVALDGRGMATLRLQWDPAGAWRVQSTNYAFSDATVPEPMSLILLASGTLGLVWRRR
jgi:hypothetical protein